MQRGPLVDSHSTVLVLFVDELTPYHVSLYLLQKTKQNKTKQANKKKPKNPENVQNHLPKFNQ